MTNAKIKELWKLLEEYSRWFALALAVLGAIYYFGGFRGLGSTGYFWYDLRRFGYWLYESVIIPICLVYGARGLWRLIFSLLVDDETDLPKYAQELKHQGYRFEDRISDLQEKNNRLQVLAKQLESKMEVVTSILSNEQQRKITSDVLEDG